MDFVGAQGVAVLLKMTAWVVLLGGALAAWRAAADTHDFRTVLAFVGAAIFISAAVAFFGYVLQLLVVLHFDTQLPAASKLAQQTEGQELEPPT